jgi:ubiquinone biosynthesis protein COQ9
MTATKPKTAKPRRKVTDGRDDRALRSAVLDAALELVPEQGFTDRVLGDAAVRAGIDAGDVARLFPDGPLGLAEGFSDAADRAMEERLADLARMKVRERITTAVLARLDVLRPHKEAARRAVAFLSLPPNAARGVTVLYRTVDAIWRAAGDTSTDFNFYTKRAILAGVYSATLMRWFTDTSEGEAETQAFLTRRIEDVMRFERLKARWREGARHLPSLADLLRRPAGRRP